MCSCFVYFAPQSVSFNFEKSSQFPTISFASKTSSLGVSEIKIKEEGKKSLQWKWGAGELSHGETLTWELSNKGIYDNYRQGIKFNMYNTKAKPHQCLKICVTKKAKTPNCAPTEALRTSCFYMSLNFKGWRAVWVRYWEFRGCTMSAANSHSKCFDKSQIMKLTVEAPKSATSLPVYIDALDFHGYISRETRDRIVPPIKDAAGNCLSCNGFERVSETDAVARHDQRFVWRQAYRWDIVNKNSASLSTNALPDAGQLKELLTIKKRTLAWYGDDEIDLDSNGLASRRWQTLLGKQGKEKCDRISGNIKCAHHLYRQLNLDAYLNGLGLDNRYGKGNLKFSLIFHKILLPMAMEYHVWSNVNGRACRLAKAYRCRKLTTEELKNAKNIMTGKDDAGTNSLESVFIAHFDNSALLPSSKDSSYCPSVKSNCANRFRKAIKALNARRINKILRVFKYVRDQGFAEGSSTGSLEHMMLTSAGYMHAAFLTADAIKAARDPEISFNNIMDTMKWYSGFGEIYQQTYEYKGTTADNTRTVMFFRLLAVMLMPEENDVQKATKIRDMLKLKQWIDNALSQNEGLFGLFKPDYLGFHHLFFYGGAYLPEALHSVSAMSYLLDGNPTFQLSSESKANIRKTLEFLRIVAVKYSTPSSVGGRYPAYDRIVLAKHFASYVFIAIKPPNLDKDNRLLPVTLKNDIALTKMLRRLANPDVACPIGNLCEGRAGSLAYVNTLGEAQIIDKVYSLIRSSPAEVSPTGNWAKNYAALSVHRRDDWVVTVKGFNHLVWDPERYYLQNRYDLFGANAGTLIANNEDALRTKDVNAGWDWIKIPGTTSINISDAQMDSVRHHSYSNPKSLAGGVSLLETGNGVFGMDYKMPNYMLPKGHILTGESFEFKKSVFFFDDVLVFLGSNIASSTAQPIVSSLFQDAATPKPSQMSANANTFYCNEGSTALIKSDFADTTTLVDRHGNKYYLPGSVAKKLVLHRRIRQHSGQSKGTMKGSGTYCKAWLDHGIKPTNDDYKYFVQVNSVPSPPHDHTKDTAKKVNIEDYAILQQTSKVHTVRVKKDSSCGHVVFDESAIISDKCPVKSVNKPCLIMTKSTSEQLFISVSYPQMNLQKISMPEDVLKRTPHLCTDGIPRPPRVSTQCGKTLRFCVADEGKSITVILQEDFKPLSVKFVQIDDKKMEDEVIVSKYVQIKGAAVTISNIKHGKSVNIAISIK
eukprot:gene17419-19163_t